MDAHSQGGRTLVTAPAGNAFADFQRVAWLGGSGGVLPQLQLGAKTSIEALDPSLEKRLTLDQTPSGLPASHHMSIRLERIHGEVHAAKRHTRFCCQLAKWHIHQVGIQKQVETHPCRGGVERLPRSALGSVIDKRKIVRLAEQVEAWKIQIDVPRRVQVVLLRFPKRLPDLGPQVARCQHDWERLSLRTPPIFPLMIELAGTCLHLDAERRRFPSDLGRDAQVLPIFRHRDVRLSGKVSQDLGHRAGDLNFRGGSHHDPQNNIVS